MYISHNPSWHVYRKTPPPHINFIIHGILNLKMSYLLISNVSSEVASFPTRSAIVTLVKSCNQGIVEIPLALCCTLEILTTCKWIPLVSRVIVVSRAVILLGPGDYELILVAKLLISG